MGSGGVAGREAGVAVSNAMVSRAPRMTSAVTGSTRTTEGRLGRRLVARGFTAFASRLCATRSLVVAISVRPSHVGPQLVELHAPPGRDDDRREPFLHD